MILDALNAIVNLDPEGMGQEMAKKRKTRQEKIILQLRRQLTKQAVAKPVLDTKSETRQEAIFIEPKRAPKEKVVPRKLDAAILSYDPRLVKKDIFKTLILTLIVLSFEFVLYLKLR